MSRTHAFVLFVELSFIGLVATPGTVSAQHHGGHGHGHGHYYGHGHYGHGHYYGHSHYYYGYPGYGYGYPYSYAPVYPYTSAPVYRRSGYYDPGSAAAAPSNSAQVQVILPDPDGEVWFNGGKTGQAGTIRLFESTPLEPGRSYTYKVTAAWHRNGELVTAERAVGVTSGNTTVVDFTRPSP